MANTFAYAALLLWPLVAVALFRHLHPARALVWTLLGAYLALPVNTGFDLRGVPLLDKSSIPNLTALLCCLLFMKEKWRLFPRDGIVIVLIAVFVLSPFLTALNNSAPIQREYTFVPAMTSYDALSQAGANAITLIPFLLGYALLHTETRRFWLLQALLIAALAYSLPMMVEMRLSPQLHRWVYGFFPHEFLQQMRAGGFRPVVFLGHGLLVAVFCAMALTVAIARWRQRIEVLRMPPLLPVVYLSVILLLCKSAGALFLGAAIGLATAVVRPKRLVLLSTLLCVFVLIYPLPRAASIVPIDMISKVAGFVSGDRQGSFATRVINEDFLLGRSAQKPIFGWGSWGRNRTSQEDTGVATVTDGTWIIAIGAWGWVGYLALFGLLTVACVRVLLNYRRIQSFSTNDAAIFAVLAINLLDLIPNSSLRPITWLIAGSACGIVRQASNRKQEQRRTDVDQSFDHIHGR